MSSDSIIEEVRDIIATEIPQLQNISDQQISSNMSPKIPSTQETPPRPLSQQQSQKISNQRLEMSSKRFPDPNSLEVAKISPVEEMSMSQNKQNQRVETKKLPNPKGDFSVNKRSSGVCSNMRKIMIIGWLAILLIVVIISLREYFLSPVTCTQKNCQLEQLSARIDSFIDRSVPPCDEFYDFACGRFHAQDLFATQQEVFHQQISTVILDSMEVDDPLLKKVRKIANSCLTSREQDNNGDQFISWLHETIGPWSLIETIDDSTISQIQPDKVAAKIAFLGLSQSVMSIDVILDDDDSSQLIIGLSQPSTIIHSPVFKNEHLLSLCEPQYIKHIEKIADKLGYHTTINPSAKMIVAVEKIIGKALSSKYEKEKSRKKMLLKDFGTKYQLASSSFNVENYVKEFLKLHNKTYTDNMQIIVSEIYFEKLQNAFNKSDSILQNSRLLYSYIIWQGVAALIGQTLGADFQPDAMTVACSSSLKATCLQPFMIEPLFYIVEKHYVEKETKNVLNETITNVGKAFKKSMNESQWMEETTKAESVKKIAETEVQIGYPPEDFIKEKMKYLSEETYDENNYFMNLLKVAKKKSWRLNAFLHPKVNQEKSYKWDSFDYAKVNAYYLRQFNAIRFPLSLHQRQVFSTDYPSYVNYGQLGVIAGHEFAHGFDLEGHKYDISGSKRDWWIENDTAKFREKTKCLIDQYNGYEIENKAVNMTPGQESEAIADNVGIRSAYFAYKKQAEGKSELPLPGLEEFTNDQMFFITWAQIWCTKNKTNDRYFTRDATHPPPSLRSLGPCRNFKEFSKAFNCPATSYMNTEECIIY